ATSASSYIFAPSWLTNLNNKTGPATTILSPAHVSTIEGNSNTNNETNEEEVVVVGSKNRDGLGVIKQVRDNMVK
ncbi:27302_t:CDS:1, partial [Dentiscutata erythropus]